MSKVDWCKRLSWTEEQLEDLRYTGYSYLRQGKYDVAITFFEGLVVLNPESSYDLQTLGALYLQINQPGKAIKILDRALKLQNVDHAPTLLNLCKALFMLDKREEGVKLARILKKELDLGIANVATALLLAHTEATPS